MSQPYESMASGQQQVWRRWQIARPTLVYVTVFPVLLAVILVISTGLLGIRLVSLTMTAPFALAAVMVLMTVVLCLVIVIMLVFAIRRALRYRRMSLEVGPRGLVHHDGRAVRRIGWAEIIALFDVPPTPQLGLRLQDGSTITLTVPTRVNGEAELQAARSLILGQLGGASPPPPGQPL